MLTKVASQIGYLELQPKREEVILDSVHMSDVFVSLPTRSGKSLCYNLLPAVFDKADVLPTGLLHRKHPNELSRASSRLRAISLAAPVGTEHVNMCHDIMYVIIAFQRATSTWRNVTRPFPFCPPLINH